MQLSMGHRHRYAAGFGRMAAGKLAAPGGVGILIALALVLGTAGWMQPASAGTQTIESVRVANLPDVVQISVQASAPLAIHDFRLGSKHAVFDLYGSLAGGQAKQVTVKSGGINSIRCGWYKSSPAIVRIAVSTSSKRPYTIQYSQGKRQAIISVEKSGGARSKSEPILRAKPRTVTARHERPRRLGSSSKSKVVLAPRPTVSAPQPKALPSPTISTGEPVVEQVKPVLVASASPWIVAAGNAVSGPESRLETKVALDFVGADIHDVLKALSLQSGVNIVASPDVKGEVTVALNNVTVGEAMRLVTNLSGYKFANVSGTYVVGTSDNLKSLGSGGAAVGGNRVAEVATIRYADAGLISKMLETQFDGVQVSSAPGGDAKSSAPNGTNVLVMSGDQAGVRTAKALVAQIEQSLATSASSTDVELYEVKYADINELAALVAEFVPGLRVTIGPNQGFDLKSPQALAMGEASGGSGGVASEGDVKKAPPKTLILQGTADEIAKAKEFLARVDVRQPQIVIEAKVVDVHSDASKELGIAWSWRDAAYSETLYDAENKPVAITLGKFNRSPVTAKVNALVESGKATVLSNPNVSSLEGKPASIFIGDEFKYVVNIQQTTTGINVTTETARVGVQLHCVSRISSDGFITMDLHPEVSVIKSFLKIPELGLAFPEISRRYVDSTVRVKDGETIAIGGLITKDEREAMAGIPILSDLPIIGGLFKTKSKSRDHSEVLMFITPRILTGT